MSLFGGPEKVSVLSDDQKRLMSTLTPFVQREIGKGGPVYDGPIAPGLSQTQRTGLGIAGTLALGGIPGVDGAITDMVAGRAAGGFDRDGYYQDAIVNPARQTLDDELRAIEARYGSNTGMSGGFGDAIGEGVSRFGTNIAGMLANLTREDRSIAQSNRAAGVNASFGRNQDIASSAAALLGAGGIERGVQAEQNLEGLNRWEAGQAYNNPWLGFVGPILGTTTHAVGQKQGIIPGIAGSVGGLLGGAGGLMSGMGAM